MQVNILSKKYIFEGFFRVIKSLISHETPKGNMCSPIERLCIERGDSVSAILFNKKTKKYVLVKQFRYPVFHHNEKDAVTIELIDGMVDTFETSEDAIAREIYEETGYKCNSLEFITSFYLSPGVSSEEMILYYALTEGGDGISDKNTDRFIGNDDEGEYIIVKEYTLEDLIKMAKERQIKDAKTLLALEIIKNMENSNNEK